MNHVCPRNAMLLIASLEFGGGAEVAVARMAETLRTAGWTVTVATLYDAERETSAPYDHRLRRGAHEPRGAFHLVRKLIGARGHSRWLANKYSKLDIDLCVSFLEESNFIALAAGRRADIPVVATVHISPRTYPFPVRRRMRRTYRRAARVVAVAESMAYDLREFFGLDNVDAIPNPIDLDDLAHSADAGLDRTTAAQLEARPTILHVGRMVPIKDQIFLLRAFSRARRRRHDLQLVLAGDGPERERLAAEAARLGIADDVVFLGHRRDVPALMTASACVALSSRVEGFSLVVAEAIALGVPVVTTDCAGPVELLGLVPDDVGTVVRRPAVAGGDDATIEDFAAAMLDVASRAKSQRPHTLPFERSVVEKAWVTLVDELVPIASSGRARRGNASS